MCLSPLAQSRTLLLRGIASVAAVFTFRVYLKVTLSEATVLDVLIFRREAERTILCSSGRRPAPGRFFRFWTASCFGIGEFLSHGSYGGAKGDA